MKINDENPLNLRWIDISDIDPCVALINEVFSINRSVTEYKWKFFNSPPKSVMVLVAEDNQTKSIRGHYAVVPIFLNMSGESLLCCQSGDTAVHKEAEGKGLFAKCASLAFETLSNQGYTCVYGFPNANSYPGFARRLGWARVGRLVKYRVVTKFKGVPLQLWRLPLLQLRISRTQANNSALGRSEFKLNSALPEGVDKLWSQVAPFEKFSLKKDKEYLEWRYSNNPICKYDYYSLETDGNLLALLIGRMEGKRFFITELLATKKDLVIATYLVQNVLRKMILSLQVDVVEFVGRDDGLFDAAFASFDKSPSSLIFCLRHFGDKVKQHQIENIVNWTVTLGDLDNL
jgi:predicted N-acetyltransferase YhbS